MYTIQVENTVITSGSEILKPDDLGSSVKQCVISTPFLFKETPNVVLTVSITNGQTGEYAGTVPFIPYSVKAFDSTGQTTFMVSASNVEGKFDVNYRYICHYYIMGELA